MAYVDENLKAGEEITYRVEPHYTNYTVPVITTIILVILAAPNEGISGVFGALFFGALISVPFFLRHKQSELALTTTRVIGRFGLLKPVYVDESYDNISGVSIDRGSIGELLDSGTIFLRDRHGNISKCKHIPNPLSLKKKIDANRSGDNT